MFNESCTIHAVLIWSVPVNDQRPTNLPDEAERYPILHICSTNQIFMPACTFIQCFLPSGCSKSVCAVAFGSTPPPTPKARPPPVVSGKARQPSVRKRTTTTIQALFSFAIISSFRPGLQVQGHRYGVAGHQSSLLMPCRAFRDRTGRPCAARIQRNKVEAFPSMGMDRL